VVERGVPFFRHGSMADGLRVSNSISSNAISVFSFPL
jgi:hypothetical protein